jgi:hypothetical protein
MARATRGRARSRVWREPRARSSSWLCSSDADGTSPRDGTSRCVRDAPPTTMHAPTHAHRVPPRSPPTNETWRVMHALTHARRVPPPRPQAHCLHRSHARASTPPSFGSAPRRGRSLRRRSPRASLRSRPSATRVRPRCAHAAHTTRPAACPPHAPHAGAPLACRMRPRLACDRRALHATAVCCVRPSCAAHSLRAPPPSVPTSLVSAARPHRPTAHARLLSARRAGLPHEGGGTYAAGLAVMRALADSGTHLSAKSDSPSRLTPIVAAGCLANVLQHEVR